MISQFQRNQDFTEDNKLTQRALKLVQGLVELDVLEGSGSPENVIEANPRRLYMNTAGTAGSILYIKRDADIGGDRSQGWILV